jgi:hypothetical protein
MNIYDIICIIMTVCIFVGAAFIIMLCAYASVYPMIMRMRTHDSATYVRTHGVVRTHAYNAKCEALVLMLMDEDDTTMCA